MLGRKKLAIIVFSASAAALLLVDYLYNIHCVIPHQIYRSAQLSKPSLSIFWHVTNVKTIVNLRGVNPAESWYKKERDFAHQNHIEHINIPFNSTRLPSQQELETLTDTLLHAKTPLLLHCSGGADRTGLASAVAKILNNAPLDEAKQQYSWRYFAFKHNDAGEQVLAAYEQWLTAHHVKHTRAHFLVWVHAKDIYSPSLRAEPKQSSLN